MRFTDKKKKKNPRRANTVCLLQVYPTGVKVLAGLEEVQDLPIQDILPSMEWRPQVVIAAACIADPYLLLHFSDGSAVLLSGDEEEGSVHLPCFTCNI